MRLRFERLEGGGLFIRVGRLSLMVGRNAAMGGLPPGFVLVWEAKDPGPRYMPVHGFVVKGYHNGPKQAGFAPEPAP